MAYTERNQLVLKEIGQRTKLQRGFVVGDSDLTLFTSLGHYSSQVLGEEVYVGLKEHFSSRKGNYEFRVAKELALIHKIEQTIPHLLPEFPAFHGVLVDSSGEPVGILTEDFSEGGRHDVTAVRSSLGKPTPKEVLPMDLQKVTRIPLEPYHLETTIFLVNGRRRIGDFDEIFIGITPRDLEETFSVGHFFDEIDKYTLTIDYSLEYQ